MQVIGKKEAVFVVGRDEFNRFVNEHYRIRGYDFSASEQTTLDVFLVAREEPLDDWDRETLKILKGDLLPHNAAEAIMRDLASRKVIPAGNYAIVD